MAHHVPGVVTEILDERPGLQRVLVVRHAGGEPERAYVITELTGSVSLGDAILMNVTAVELGLGTGGWHFVSANQTCQGFSAAGHGHIMKLRYTPMQVDTGAAIEEFPNLSDDLEGVPVVVCTVHSQVPLVVLGALSLRPDAAICYVMTDGASLPIAMSGLVETMQSRGWLRAGTITAGHAFGGDREAVGIPDALVLARHVAHADLIVVGMGPGVVGTGHRLGNTALEAAPILDTTVALDGRASLCVRASSGDRRPRHFGLSHHSATVMDLVRSRIHVPVVPRLVTEVEPWRTRHDVAVIDDVDAKALLCDAEITVTTMGRGPDQDGLFFDAAAAAGMAAAR